MNNQSFGLQTDTIYKPICIFRPREGSRDLKSDFDGKNRIWLNLAENGRKWGFHHKRGFLACPSKVGKYPNKLIRLG